MLSPQALPYSRFLEILILLDCAIPVLPSESGAEYLIFARGGSGYFARPSGNCAPFVHRDNDERVPVLEIEKTINLLGIKPPIFWEAAENCQVNPTPGVTQSPKPKTPPKH